MYITSYYIEYFNILLFSLVSILIVFILLILSYMVSPKAINLEKLSTYECGFEPFDSTKKTFDLHFFVIGVLFLIFDLEIVFLFPWAVNLVSIGLFGFWTMIFFILVLTIGFVYEWNRGTLEWTFNTNV